MTDHVENELILANTDFKYIVSKRDIIAIRIRSMVKAQNLFDAMPDKAALVAVNFFNANNKCIPIKNLSFSKKVGSFFYIKSGADKWRTTIRSFVTPEAATRVEIALVLWNKKIVTHLAAPPDIKLFENNYPAIDDLCFEYKLNGAASTIHVAGTCQVLSMFGGNPKASKCAVATVYFCDENGVLPPVGDNPAVSNQFGLYYYLDG